MKTGGYSSSGTAQTLDQDGVGARISESGVQPSEIVFPDLDPIRLTSFKPQFVSDAKCSVVLIVERRPRIALNGDQRLAATDQHTRSR